MGRWMGEGRGGGYQRPTQVGKRRGLSGMSTVPTTSNRARGEGWNLSSYHQRRARGTSALQSGGGKGAGAVRRPRPGAVHEWCNGRHLMFKRMKMRAATRQDCGV